MSVVQFVILTEMTYGTLNEPSGTGNNDCNTNMFIMVIIIDVNVRIIYWKNI